MWIAGLDNEALATGASQGSEDAARARHRGIPRWEEAEEEQEAEEQDRWG